MIELQKVKKSFKQGEKSWTLGEINLKIKAQESVALLGASGSGKSTLLHLIATLLPLEKGKIVVEGQDLSRFSAIELSVWRNQKIGFVFQDFFLFPEFTLLENVQMPLLVAGEKDLSPAEKVLKEVGLADFAQHFPHELSGGQKQRGAIARALVRQPKIILADEPTGNLDAETAQVIIKLLSKVQKEHQATLLLATHDKNLSQICNRQIKIDNGQII